MRDDRLNTGHDTQETLSRVGRWLTQRPVESWGFFAAGFIIARVLF